MITVIMFIGAIAFFVSIMFAPNMRTRWILGLITGLIFVGSTVIITANFHGHWGMKRITTTKTQKNLLCQFADAADSLSASWHFR